MADAGGNPCGEKPLYYGTWTDFFDKGVVHRVVAFNGQHYFMRCGATADFDVLLEVKGGLADARTPGKIVTCLGCLADGW